jgi:predicted regulator of Ras-like GTPase activity (Roadblock/LC7/MglB family)
LIRRRRVGLSYVLSKQGYAIDSELAGEDRPDSVGALMRGIFALAGIGRAGMKSD